MRRRSKHPVKGFLAGAAAGLAASAAMSEFHSIFQRPGSSSDAGEKEDSTVQAASAIAGIIFRHKLTREQKRVAGSMMHYGFGATLGAFYGAAVEFVPELRAGCGALFGVAAWLGAHVITVPALGLSDPITKSAPAAEAIEFGAHLVYGVTAESLRCEIRKLIG